MRERLFCMESPTHVGNTHGVLRRGSAPAVHPHACGEYIEHHVIVDDAGGSSPRVWGIPHAACPAAPCPVHPHACGEYGFYVVALVLFIGSSPRVWGIHHPLLDKLRQNRFIPTRVGNTPAPTLKNRPWPVHPHACGEYSYKGSFRVCNTGSSPRVWGIRERARGVVGENRFIPTRVGNTPPGGWSQPGFAVHPHACGEYAEQTLHRSERLSLKNRFIPTRVGNTPHVPDRGCTDPVHPHACGEYKLRQGYREKEPGSSPRVWGIL